ncbi:MAG: PRC-barrel domain-containing protein [Pseudomonadota bacterium]
MKLPMTLAALALSATSLTSLPALANCQEQLNNLPQSFQQSSNSGNQQMTAKDMRRLRQAARILMNNGYDDTCAEVADVLSEKAGQSQQANSSQSQNQQQNQNQPRSENQQRLRLAKNAQPIMKQDGTINTQGLVGSEIYSAETGEALGDIEDVIIGGQQPSIIVGHGGLLGLGEKRVKLPLEQVKVNQNDESFYVAMRPKEVEQMQPVERQDGRWVTTGGSSNNQQQQQQQSSQQQQNERNQNRQQASQQGQQQRQQQQNSNQQQQRQQQGENPEMRRLAQNAVPVTEQSGRFNANGLIGSEVYSAQTGEAVGDIEDIIMGGSNRGVILGNGGLLGMGEKRVRLPLNELKVNTQENRYFVSMTPRQVEQQQQVEKQNGRWVKVQQQSQNNQSSNQSVFAMNNNNNNAQQRQQSDRPDPSSLMQLTEMRSAIVANDLIGRQIYSTKSGESIGDIQDFVVQVSGDSHTVILGHGGFLGLGEKNIKLKLTDIRVRPSDNRYFVAMSNARIERMAGVTKRDGAWTGKAVSAQTASQSQQQSN